MAQAKEGNTVKVHYTGKFRDGSVFDSSAGREPLAFTVGQRQVIPGFEKAVTGLEPGEKTTVEIPPTEAYGEYQENLVLTVERNHLPPDYTPEVGHQLQSRTQDGNTISAVIAEVTESSVKLDTNHPLAGKDLIFDIELVEVG